MHKVAFQPPLIRANEMRLFRLPSHPRVLDPAPDHAKSLSDNEMTNDYMHVTVDRQNGGVMLRLLETNTQLGPLNELRLESDLGSQYLAMYAGDAKTFQVKQSRLFFFLRHWLIP
jgi:hypothetical protein